jgi:hypothetical protein
MKRVLGFVVTFGVFAMLVAPALARVVAIETAVALTDDSEPAVDAAVAEAMDTVARGARAMGFVPLQLTRVAIVEHTVVIGILATDTPAGREPDGTPSPDESSPPSSNGPADELSRASASQPSSGIAEWWMEI